MNSSLNKLFKSQKSGNAHYLETNLIEAPIRKKLVDSRLQFEQAVLNYKIEDTVESFKYYSISYVFAIEYILNQFASIQRRISTQGVTQENIQKFGELSKKRQDGGTIYLFFKQLKTNSISISDFKSFSRGYRDAEESVRSICNYIYEEQNKRQLTDATVYTSFWELTSRELIELPENF